MPIGSLADTSKTSKFHHQGLLGPLSRNVFRSSESNVTPEETRNTQGYWAKQLIWHSEHHCQEKHTFLQTTPLLLGKALKVQPERGGVGLIRKVR